MLGGGIQKYVVVIYGSSLTFPLLLLQGELRRQHVLDGGGAHEVLQDVRRRPLGQGGRRLEGRSARNCPIWIESIPEFLTFSGHFFYFFRELFRLFSFSGNGSILINKHALDSSNFLEICIYSGKIMGILGNSYFHGMCSLSPPH